jgi:hypothetical protein
LSWSGPDLFDHIVGAGEQHWRDRNPEGPGCLEVDHELELGRLLDRQRSGIGALEDLVDEGRGAEIDVAEARAVGGEAASLGEAAKAVDGRKLVL